MRIELNGVEYDCGYCHSHPDAKHIATHYRKYLVGQKRVWMAQGKGNRCLRGIIHYKDIVYEYIAAKKVLS